MSCNTTTAPRVSPARTEATVAAKNCWRSVPVAISASTRDSPCKHVPHRFDQFGLAHNFDQRAPRFRREAVVREFRRSPDWRKAGARCRSRPRRPRPCSPGWRPTDFVLRSACEWFRSSRAAVRFIDAPNASSASPELSAGMARKSPVGHPTRKFLQAFHAIRKSREKSARLPLPAINRIMNEDSHKLRRNDCTTPSTASTGEAKRKNDGRALRRFETNGVVQQVAI